MNQQTWTTIRQQPACVFLFALLESQLDRAIFRVDKREQKCRATRIGDKLILRISEWPLKLRECAKHESGALHFDNRHQVGLASALTPPVLRFESVSRSAVDQPGVR